MFRSLAIISIIILIPFPVMAEWAPPTGIPKPDFGINETHYMYEGKFYDAGGFYYRDAGNGPYTHYVDNSVSCTDTNNEYGTVSNPRCTIPTELALGSVVEIHGGPYRKPLIFSGLNGTAEKPIWVRGADTADKAEIRLQQNKQAIKIYDSFYVIFENLFFNGSEKNVTSSYLDSGVINIQENSTHIVLRHIDIFDYPQAEPCEAALCGISISLSSSWSQGEVNQYHLLYDINMSNYRSGEWPPDCESGGQGICIIDGVDRIWILNSTFENIAEDAIHILGYHGRHDISLKRGPHNGLPNYVYIGYNKFYREGENAIDVKESNHVIISQNVMHYFRSTNYYYGWSGGGGQAIVINDEGDSNIGGDETAKNTWVLYNKIYDCNIGISDMSGRSSYILGNLIYNIVPTPSHYGYGIYVNKPHSNIPEAIEWIVGNTIHNFTHYGCLISNSYDAYVQNNIISELQNQSYYHLRLVNIHGAKDVRNQLFFDSGNVKTTGFECIDCIQSSESPFWNEESNEFFLAPGSPAVDSGYESEIYNIFQSFYGIPIEYDIIGTQRPQGSGWDIGAYEYVPEKECQPGDSFIRLNSTYIKACSCNQTDVQAAIDAANDGDTVLVPEGECVWTTNGNNPAVFINEKSLILKGKGIDKTVIIGNSTGHGVMQIPLLIFTIEGKPIRITNFTFKGKGNEWDHGLINFGTNWNNSIGGTRDIRIDHCKFENIINNEIRIDSNIYGVIDHCIFNCTDWGVFVSVSGSNSNWEMPISLGTSNALFVEDSVVYINGNGEVIDSYSGGKYVFRHNYLKDGSIGTHGICHGAQGNRRSAHTTEIYRNKIYSDINLYTAIGIHGGTGVIFDNIFVGSFNNKILVFEYRSCPKDSCFFGKCNGSSLYDGNLDSSGYPCLDQIGRTSDFDHNNIQDLFPLYEWNNTCNGFDVNITINTWGCPDPFLTLEHIRKNRDFYDDAVSYNPKTGFYEANYTDDDGSVKKWVYKPYIYPHPLTVAPFGTKICGEGQITEECWCQGMRTSGQCLHGYYSGCIHKSDADCDGRIILQELLAFINRWKRNQATLMELMEAIRMWKSG